MPATLAEIGIQSSTETTVESLSFGRAVEVEVIQTLDSSFAQAQKYDPVDKWSIKGRGSLPAAITLAGSESLITELTGGVTICDTVKHAQTNTSFDTWEASGMHYPSAS